MDPPQKKQCTEPQSKKWRSTALTGPVDKQSEAYPRRIAARAMLRATGFTEEDFKKPIITVAVTYTNATPCNHHVREMGDIIVKQIEELGGKAFVFGTPVVSDGETTGIKGMNYSLISRDLIVRLTRLHIAIFVT
jgi:dihydroxy-acid dehydratase